MLHHSILRSDTLLARFFLFALLLLAVPAAGIASGLLPARPAEIPNPPADRYLFAFANSSPSQITAFQVFDATAGAEIVQNSIIYGGPAYPGLSALPGFDIGDPITQVQGAAYDPVNQIVFVVSNHGQYSALLQVDMLTGIATSVGFIRYQVPGGSTYYLKKVQALAYDPVTETLYAVQKEYNGIATVDPSSGLITPLTYPPVQITTNPSVEISALAFDLSQMPPVLYGVDENHGHVFIIDVATGSGSHIGTITPAFIAPWFRSIEFDLAGTMFGLAANGDVFTIDRENGFLAAFLGSGLAESGEALVLPTELQFAGQLTPVELMSFVATTEATGAQASVTLQWATASETENLGFHIYRSRQPYGLYECISADLIAGAGTTNDLQQYSFIDAGAEYGVEYWYKLADIDLRGQVMMHGPILVIAGVATPVDAGGEVLPQSFALLQNYPNPFNPSTVISYELPVASEVSLAIYAVTGQQVRELVSSAMPPGVHQVSWDGTDAYGQRVASGVYFYALYAEDRLIAQRKLLLMK